MEEQVFFFYAGLSYLVVAFVGSMYVAYRTHKSNEVNQTVKTTTRDSFPEGKIAFCKACDRYLLDDDQLKEHPQSRRHQHRSVNIVEPIEWRSQEVAKFNPDKAKKSAPALPTRKK